MFQTEHTRAELPRPTPDGETEGFPTTVNKRSDLQMLRTTPLTHPSSWTPLSFAHTPQAVYR